MCRAATPPLDKLAAASASSLAAGHELHAPSEADLAREGPLSREQVAEFYESGVVLVRGLLQGDLLDRMLAVRRSVGTMMPNAETYGTVKTEAWREHACFLDVALRSPLAAAAEQLTPDEVRGAGRGKPLRVLRDGFFSLSPGKRGCGWHVDDFFFWPTKRDGPGPGVNVWVALDAVEAGAGGGLAYAPGSHRPDFLPQRAVIAPPGEAPQTCEMQSLSPDSHAALEAIKECPALQPGDAIIHTRFIFHRGDPHTSEGGTPVARYSVRYVPASSQLEGINFLPPEEPGGPPRRVTLSGVTIDGAGPEHGHFPSTELRE